MKLDDVSWTFFTVWAARLQQGGVPFIHPEHYLQKIPHQVAAQRLQQGQAARKVKLRNYSSSCQIEGWSKLRSIWRSVACELCFKDVVKLPASLRGDVGAA